MNVLGMGPMELLLILILALVVFGPGKLPEVMGQVGRAVRDFRRTTSEISEEFTRTIKEEVEETRAAVEGTPSPRAAVAAPPAAPLSPSPAANGTHTPSEAPVPGNVIWQAPRDPGTGTPDPPPPGPQKPPPPDSDLRPPY